MSTITTEPTRRRRQPGWFYPWIYVLGFLVVFAANGTLIYFALHSFSGLTTEHAYAEGVAYNQTLEAAAAQEQRGWQVATAFAATKTEAGGYRGKLDVGVRDHSQGPLPGAIVTALFIRPTSQGADVSITLTDRGEGRYQGAVELPLPGVWDYHLTVRHRTGDFQKTQRVVIKD